MAKKDEVTPMMKQFFDLKAKHPDALMLFRCGDFYETYSDDAVIASKILGITLTKRSSGMGKKEDATPMAGFPHHALDTYLPKLIRAGKRVAICDQLEDPKLTKKLVKRGITELVTPGVALNDNVLNNKENNFLASVNIGKATIGIAFLDISTGEFLIAEGTGEYIEKLISNFSPKEILYERGKKQTFESLFGNSFFTFEMDEWVFTYETARKKLISHFQTHNLKGFGIEHLKDATVAAGTILYYLEQTQHNNIEHIRNISRIDEEKYVRIDRFTSRSLELTSTINEEGKSLLDIIDKTTTPMGGRTIRRWMLFPLKDVEKIKRRQNVVEYFFRSPELRDTVSFRLENICDLERIASKISTGRINPREMVALKNALNSLEGIKEACMAADDDNIKLLGNKIDVCEKLRDEISKTLVENPPLLTNKEGIIADGVNEELDELRKIAHSGKEYLINMQQREIELTGIQSLKIGYNNVFGYYIEVRNTYKELVPKEWIRKQTLVNAERYITEELKEYEEKILGAEDKILSLESRLFNSLVMNAADYLSALQTNSNIIANIDCMLSFAKAAKEYKYIRPIVDESYAIDIKNGRHPVIERQMPIGEEYIANDVFLDTDSQQIIVLTGPNMAGKSALLRQTALICIMAQIGSFVPADSAKIGLVDKIFTRVGASDNISLGESTFMVEMNEASNILNNISQRSLVLFDELGRGTSTYDGISIAWAIVEYLHSNSKGHPRTLFATHYHELNDMERLFPRIKNFNVSVKEINGKIIFMRKLERGGSNHSFGIHVAKLAGMAPSIVKRADEILHELEANNSHEKVSSPRTAQIQREGEAVQLSFFNLDDPVLCQIRDEILTIDINNLTPVEALNKLNEIKKILKGKS